MAVGRTSPFRVIFCTAVFAAAVYAGVAFGRPIYRYHVVESELVQISILTGQSAPQLREMVLEVLQRREVPVEPESVRVFKDESDDVGIYVSWEEDVYLFGRYVTTRHFVVNVGGAVR